MKLTKILVGDDQVGENSANGQRMRRDFELDYKKQFKNALLAYTADPEKFIDMAKQGNYDVLLIDLNWCSEDAIRKYKTGYRILEAMKDYAPVRVLWTSERTEDREQGYQYGATHCISKRPIPSEFEKIIMNNKEEK